MGIFLLVRKRALDLSYSLVDPSRDRGEFHSAQRQHRAEEERSVLIAFVFGWLSIMGYTRVPGLRLSVRLTSLVTLLPGLPVVTIIVVRLGCTIFFLWRGGGDLPKRYKFFETC